MTLNIKSVEHVGPNEYVSLEGSLDASTSDVLEQFIDKFLSHEFKTLVLDLNALTFISSAGLRVFAKLRRMMRSREGRLFFVNLSPQVKKVFDIVKAAPLSDVFASEGELDAYLAEMQRQVDGAV